jgi:hypothetical protein
MSTTPDAATQLSNLEALRLKYQNAVDQAHEEFESQRERVMDSLCERLDDPDSIDSDWFRAHGSGLVRANAALAAAKQRLDDLNEVRAAMRREAR